MVNGIIALAAALAIAISTIAPALGQGKTAAAAVESMARQPEIQNSLRTTMFIGVGLIEAVPIIAIVIAFMLLNK